MNLSKPTPLIVNPAPNGTVSSPARNPHVPLDETGILRDVTACAQLGASIARLHVRDAAGLPSSEPARFESLIAALDCVVAPDVRVGLEDSPWNHAARKKPRNNPEMIRWLTGLARAHGRPIAPPGALRQRPTLGRSDG